MSEFGKVVIFGTGLIGGSFALALKEAEAVEEVVGFGRTPSTLRVAQELGVIDRAGINPTHEIEDADIVLVATPVAQMPEIFERIAPYLGPNTIVTDGGSDQGVTSLPPRAPRSASGSASSFRPPDRRRREERRGGGARRISTRQAGRADAVAGKFADDGDHVARPGQAAAPTSTS